MIASAPVAEPRRDVVRIGHDALFPQQGRESGDNILSCHGTVLCLGIHRRFNLWPIASASQKGFDLFHSVLLLFTASAAEPVQWAQLTIEQRVIIRVPRSEEHTSELQSLMRISYAVFCLKKKKTTQDELNVHNPIYSLTVEY